MVEVLLVLLLIATLILMFINVSVSLLLIRCFEGIKAISEIQMMEIEQKQKNRGLLDIPASKITYDMLSRK
jgi:hypothetical protein